MSTQMALHYVASNGLTVCYPKGPYYMSTQIALLCVAPNGLTVTYPKYITVCCLIDLTDCHAKGP